MCIHFQAIHTIIHYDFFMLFMFSFWIKYIEYFEPIQLEVSIAYTVFITEHPNRL